MGFHLGSTYDYATLRAYLPRTPADVARKPVKPRRRLFGAR